MHSGACAVLGQTHAVSVAPGRAVLYNVSFYNDGDMPDNLRVTGTAGNSLWTVQYIDHVTGADISAAVTGVGWQVPTLRPGAGRGLKVLVAPSPSARAGQSRNILITGVSTSDAKKKGTVKACTGVK